MPYLDYPILGAEIARGQETFFSTEFIYNLHSQLPNLICKHEQV